MRIAVIKSFSHNTIETFTGIPPNNSPQKWDVHITLPLLAGRALQWTALLWQMLACLSLLENSELLHFWSGLPERSSIPTSWSSFLKQRKVCAETCSSSARSVNSSFQKKSYFLWNKLKAANSSRSQCLQQPLNKGGAMRHHLQWSLAQTPGLASCNTCNLDWRN